MKIAVCDDIKEYRLSIKKYITEYLNEHHISGIIDEYSDGISFLKSKTNYDILFLDVELGDSNGINIAKKIKSKSTLIVIVTSYRKYLDAAIDLNVLRYIDKPITQDRIFSALDKAMEKMNETIVTIKTKDNEIIRIKITDIIFVESKLRTVGIYTKSGIFITRENLKSLKEKLKTSYFAVPHNSYIINMNYISNFKRDEITITTNNNDYKISISTRKQPEFKQKFLDFIREDY